MCDTFCFGVWGFNPNNKWQEDFFSQLLIIIKRKKSYQLVVDEGWYSESELQELGWNQYGS